MNSTDSNSRVLVEENVQLSEGTIVLYSLLSIFCIICAALAAGLTQGMLSINPLELKIKLESGQEIEKEAARKVLPIISEHHLLLVTLMLFNATANEALPIFLDQLLPSWLSILMSVTLVLMFGEIIPSAIFTGPKQLEIASFLAPFVKVLIAILSPIGYPISLVLDYFLGHDEGITVFNRTEMAAMVRIIHQEGKSEKSPQDNLMNKHQVKIIGGALKYTDMVVNDIMTSYEDMFALSIDIDLNYQCISDIFQSGFSRIPIYDNDRNNIVGLLLSKDLIFVDPEDEIPLRSFMNMFGRTIITVWPDHKLGDVLSVFQKRHSHLAVVRDVDSSGPGDPKYITKGLITLEDIIEEILGADIEDETDDFISDLQMRSIIPTSGRDMDHVRLKILSSVKTDQKDKKISQEEINNIGNFMLSNYFDVCQILCSLSSTNITVQSDMLAYLNRKIESSEVIQLIKRTPENSLKPVSSDMIYRKGRLSNACTLVLEGVLTLERRVFPGNLTEKVEYGPGSIIAVNAIKSNLPSSSVQNSGGFIPDFNVYITSTTVRILRITNAPLLVNIPQGKARRVKDKGKESTEKTKVNFMNNSDTNSNNFNVFSPIHKPSSDHSYSKLIDKPEDKIDMNF